MANNTGVYQAAEAYYNAPVRQYFPGATVAPFNQYQQAAQQQLMQGAHGMIPRTEKVAQHYADYANRVGTGVDRRLAQQLSGVGASFDAYQNRGLEDAISAMRSSSGRDFDRRVGQYLGQDANAAGQRGSSREAIQRAMMQGDQAARLDETEAKMRMAGYESGLGRQIQDRATTLNALNQFQARVPGQYQAALSTLTAPMQAQMAYGQTLGGIGKDYQGLSQRYLDDARARHDFGQQAAINKLRDYASLVQGNTGGGTRTTTTQAPQQQSAWGPAAGQLAQSVFQNWGGGQQAQPATQQITAQPTANYTMNQGSMMNSGMWGGF